MEHVLHQTLSVNGKAINSRLKGNKTHFDCISQSFATCRFVPNAETL